jgi:hypothetical protein
VAEEVAAEARARRHEGEVAAREAPDRMGDPYGYDRMMIGLLKDPSISEADKDLLMDQWNDATAMRIMESKAEALNREIAASRWRW